jgi:chromosome partitioning protein
LANLGYRVLAIDLDPQSNLSFSFITVDRWKQVYQYDRTIKFWFDAYLERQEFEELSRLVVNPDVINQMTTGRLDLILSHLGLINVDLELAVMLGGASPRQSRNNFLRVYSLLSKGLADLKDCYDIVLIDCPPNFNIVTQNALVASDYYLIPAKPDYLSTIGVDQLRKHVEELTRDYNTFATQFDDGYDPIDPILLGIVLTMVGIRNNEIIAAQRQYKAQMVREGIPIFGNHIRENKTAYANAPEYGVPVVMSNMSGETYVNVRSELESLTWEFARKVGLRWA